LIAAGLLARAPRAGLERVDSFSGPTRLPLASADCAAVEARDVPDRARAFADPDRDFAEADRALPDFERAPEDSLRLASTFRVLDRDDRPGDPLRGRVGVSAIAAQVAFAPSLLSGGRAAYLLRLLARHLDFVGEPPELPAGFTDLLGDVR
jgi:hypothetical protein